jgi:hypothetical protein
MKKGAVEEIKTGDWVVPVDGNAKPFPDNGGEPLEIKEYRVAEAFDMGICSAPFLNLSGVDGDFPRRYFKKIPTPEFA